MLNTTNINSLWGALIVEELRRNGVRFFCVSPGSRSAPLAVAVAENSGVEHVVHFDERGAAFHALGIARATGAPVALVCTSGTAVANYLPAVVEASQSRVPLILLTADRPPELLDAGANQTIGQPGIFGSYTRWAFTLPCPDTVIAPETVLTTIDQAVYRARRAPSGPVHLNCQYREPLAPVSANEDLGVYAARLASWREASAPWTSYSVPTTEPSDLDALIQLIRTAQSGILAVGRLDSPDEREAVRTLARVLGWPAFPDVASGLRLGAPDVPFISHYDLLLLSKAFRDRCVPDVVLHIGGPVTSKRWMHYIEAVNPRHYILAANHPMRQDPAHRVTERIEADLPHFCHALAGPLDRAAKTDHTRHFIEADQRVRELLEARLDGDGPLTEPAVARIVSRHAPADATLFLGNSMPIRDMDLFAAPDGPPVWVEVNRGASGIDGNVATAAGIARGSGRPVVAIIGDMALLHDLNSLALMARSPVPVVLIVVNNDGGGIFHFLPIADFETGFEEFFAAPHGRHFDHAAAMFGLRYVRPESKSAFEHGFGEALRTGQSTLIEVDTDRAENRRVHDLLYRAVASALE